MKLQTAVVIGATGLIGNLLTHQLLNDAAFDKVRVLVRRELDFSHAKLEVCVIDFNNLADFKHQLGNGNSIFCCIGTTQKQVKGDKNEYRKIDFDIAVNAAHFAKEAGFNKYLLVSAIGADKTASNFYLQLKGEVEEAVIAIRFDSCSIFRPSFLLGDRKELRLGELLGKNIFKAVSALFFGSLVKYKAIEAEDVAKAMIAAAKLESRGTAIYLYDGMIKLVS